MVGRTPFYGNVLSDSKQVSPPLWLSGNAEVLATPWLSLWGLSWPSHGVTQGKSTVSQRETWGRVVSVQEGAGQRLLYGPELSAEKPQRTLLDPVQLHTVPISQAAN